VEERESGTGTEGEGLPGAGVLVREVKRSPLLELLISQLSSSELVGS
jgi:hypothetical protein